MQTPEHPLHAMILSNLAEWRAKGKEQGADYILHMVGQDGEASDYPIYCKNKEEMDKIRNGDRTARGCIAGIWILKEKVGDKS